MIKKTFSHLAVVLALVFAVEKTFAGEVPKLKTQNVFLITTDGLRWLDVFNGADPALALTTNGGGGVMDKGFQKSFWRETSEARREALMPFFWNVIVKQGQIYGNQQKGSIAQITNNRRFSYPGYNEILTGFPDERINSNDPIPNANVTVLEWLHGKPKFKNSVAVFSAWNVMPFIINRDRCGFPVMGGWEPVPDKKPNPRQALLNDLIRTMTRENEGELSDAILYQAAHEHLLVHQPRVLFCSFLETDHWGHAGRYDRVLETAHQVDTYIRQLWETAQSLPQYRDKTTFIITCDHGRGMAPVEWKSHGIKIDGAENIWMAFLGPDTPPLGERTNCGPVTQNQIAATLAAFLGEDYKASVSRAGEVMRDVFPKGN